ncbi:telomere-protecting terminal protein Tpg [Streptomyces canus]|uniref:telomere-protecting terminal protein Tpg n=1 Tax=Streptomyces canus TaxID=58343 RepID=UPI0027859179|nr:XRE family transcriptional regulator [Streptomyces canus]MDQ1065263.1 DNA-binding transcriptional regulator YdaS (Cro superfamily) [Streptomyces canus]
MAGEIGDAIERADRESFTRQPPKTLKGQIGYLIKQLGSAKAVAQEIGVTADSVNRYRRGARKHARKDVAAKIDDAVRQRWQPQVRKRGQRKAATTGGITVETRARFGYTAPVGTTDDGRFRRLTVHLPPGVRPPPLRAREAGASDGPLVRRSPPSRAHLRIQWSSPDGWSSVPLSKTSLVHPSCTSSD